MLQFRDWASSVIAVKAHETIYYPYIPYKAAVIAPMLYKSTSRTSVSTS